MASPTFAELETPQRYDIEVIIFERLAKSVENDPEAWTKQLELRYPNHWRQLIDPVEEQRKKEEAERQRSAENQWLLSDGFIDSIDRQMNGTVDTDTTDTTPDLQTNAQLDAQTPPTTNNTPENQEAASMEADSEPTQVPVYEFLPSEYKQLTQQAKAVNRAHELRLLFHQTWQQPLEALDKAPALVIKGGNQFGDHYELEGYLTLHIKRYIHLESHLWLSQFVPNHGQTSDHWPSLPTPPSLEERLLKSIALDNIASTVVANEHTRSALSSEPANPFQAAIAQDSQLETPLTLGEEQREGQTPAPYLTQQIMTLKQSRKMRSKELHYIDHPRLGILVLVSPVEENPEKI